MNIEHISVSRKQVFDQCELKYKYQYHLRLKTEVEEPFYFVYGTIVHRIAEVYVERKGESLISEVAQDVLSGKIYLDERYTKAPTLPTEYKRRLPIHLKAIKILTDKMGYEGELEWQFKYDLDPPNNCLITGFIDRLIIQGDKYWIVDYKTTKAGPWRKTSKNIASDLQLKVYARVVQRHFGAKAENIKCALYYLEDAEIVAATFSQESLEQVEMDLLRTFRTIREKPPEAAVGRVGEHCRRCEYNDRCPLYNANNGVDINDIIKG